MKKLIIIATTLVLFPFLGNAQSKSLKNIYKTYDKQDDAVNINISGNILNMFNWYNNDEKDEDLEKIAKAVTSLRIFSVSKGKEGMDKLAMRRFRKSIQAEDFEDLMTIRNSDGNFYVMVKERNGIVKDLVMFGEGEHGNFFLELLGNMKAKKVAKFMNNIEVDSI